MAVLTDQEIARAAYDGGFTMPGVIVAIAVCLAESSGNPAAHVNACCYGLMQINKDAHLDIWSDNWQDPVTNMRMAHDISHGYDFSAWSAFTNGSYGKFMNRAQKAAAHPIGGPIGGVVGGVSGTAGAVGNLASSVGGFLKILTSQAFWIRAIAVIGGVILLIIGLAMAMKLQDKLPAVIPV